MVKLLVQANPNSLKHLIAQCSVKEQLDIAKLIKGNLRKSVSQTMLFNEHEDLKKCFFDECDSLKDWYDFALHADGNLIGDFDNHMEQMIKSIQEAPLSEGDSELEIRVAAFIDFFANDKKTEDLTGKSKAIKCNLDALLIEAFVKYMNKNYGGLTRELKEHVKNVIIKRFNREAQPFIQLKLNLKRAVDHGFLEFPRDELPDWTMEEAEDRIMLDMGEDPIHGTVELDSSGKELP